MNRINTWLEKPVSGILYGVRLFFLILIASLFFREYPGQMSRYIIIALLLPIDYLFALQRAMAILNNANHAKGLIGALYIFYIFFSFDVIPDTFHLHKILSVAQILWLIFSNTKLKSKQNDKTRNNHFTRLP